MANIRKWSSSASGNASVAGGSTTINWAEGQAPSTVNNSARETMAQLRSIYVPSQWGWVEYSATASVASQTTFKIAGDQTTDYVATRRVKLRSASTTRYATITSSSYTTETTVTVTVDSGSLSASHTLVAISAITTDNVPTLGSYVTSASLATALSPYITSNSASIALATKNASLLLYDEGVSISSAGSTAITAIDFVGANVSVSLSAGRATVTVISAAAGSTLTVIRKATQDTRSSTTLTDDSDFTFSMLANTNYLIKFTYDLTQSAASTGIKIGLSGPAAPTTVLFTSYAIVVDSTVTYSTPGQSTTSGSGVATFTQTAGSGTGEVIVQGEIVWRNGANAGTFKLQTARQGAAGSTVFKVDSEMNYITF